MAGFLTENTRDWLTIIGIVLAALQTVLALGTRPAESKRVSEAARSGVPPRRREGVVAGLASEIGVSERALWVTIAAIYPGVTLLVMLLFALAPLPAPGTRILVKDDSGFALGVAQVIQAAQGFFGLVLGLMLTSQRWGIEDAGFVRVPRRVLLLLGGGGVLVFYLSLALMDWADQQPVAWVPRFASSTAGACLAPAILCMLGMLIGLVEPAIDRWMERVK